MVTSNTTSYNPVRDIIIRRSLRMVGAYSADGSPTANQIVDAIDVLNMMVKEWQMDGLMWLKCWGILFLNKGQSQYLLAASDYSGFSHCAFASSPGVTSYIQTTMRVSAVLGASSVTVSSATGMTNADFIGIANDNGIIEWFYASVSGLVISLFSDVALTTPAALTAAATSGNVVYSHKVLTQINRPTRITSAVRKLYDSIAANGYEIPLEPPGGISRTDYERLPNKTTQGKIINYYYDPQLIAGVLSVWPTADNPGDKLVLTIDRPLQDILNDTETYDMPQEASKAIADCLAFELEPEYPLDASGFQKLSTRAIASKQKLINFNREITASQFQPDMR